MTYQFGCIRGHISSFADQVAKQAVGALITEVCITPKPGLVDRANSGAHKDMDIFTFVDSSLALFPYFRDITAYSLTYDGVCEGLLSKLVPRGIQAEQDMLLATGGVNTHKGAIFSLGVLCAAVAVVAKQTDTAREGALQDACVALAAGRTRTKALPANDVTNGARIYARYGIRGVLGEAAAGFPHVFALALPRFRERIKLGNTIETAGIVALLHLIAHVDDTNIIARCGIETLREVQEMVRGALREHSKDQSALRYRAYAQELDSIFIQRGISPGGCADLLAATLLIDALFPQDKTLPASYNETR
jgi:triphosphoribosyl-dephospho-CoA synthase CitG